MKLDLSNATLPRKRKIPHWSLNENVDGSYEAEFEVEGYYRKYFYNAIDTVVNSINSRFNQPGYLNYENIEQLLINAVKGAYISPWIDKVIETYKGDIDPFRLRVQLQQLPGCLKIDKYSIQEITKYVKENMSEKKRSFISEVVKILKLLLLVPGTNATSERSGSSLLRLKNWLRTTMSQERLNHLLLLTVHKEKTDLINLVDIGNSFIIGNRD